MGLKLQFAPYKISLMNLTHDGSRPNIDIYLLRVSPSKTLKCNDLEGDFIIMTKRKLANKTLYKMSGILINRLHHLYSFYYNTYNISHLITLLNYIFFSLVL